MQEVSFPFKHVWRQYITSIYIFLVIPLPTHYYYIECVYCLALIIDSYLFNDKLLIH